MEKKLIICSSLCQKSHSWRTKNNNFFLIVSDAAAIKCYSCNLLSGKTAQVKYFPKEPSCHYAGAKRGRKNRSHDFHSGFLSCQMSQDEFYLQEIYSLYFFSCQTSRWQSLSQWQILLPTVWLSICTKFVKSFSAPTKKEGRQKLSSINVPNHKI